MQWIKKFWDTNFPGTQYDAEGRRAGQVAAPPPLVGAVTVGQARNAPAARAPVRAAAAASSTTARRPVARSSASAAVPNETIQALTAQMDEMKVSVDSLEKERDFYFAKLRDIEIIVQERNAILEQDPNEQAETDTLNQILAILYSTEEGFEVPEGQEVRQSSPFEPRSAFSTNITSSILSQPVLDEEETF